MISDSLISRNIFTLLDRFRSASSISMLFFLHLTPLRCSFFPISYPVTELLCIVPGPSSVLSLPGFVPPRFSSCWPFLYQTHMTCQTLHWSWLCTKHLPIIDLPWLIQDSGFGLHQRWLAPRCNSVLALPSCSYQGLDLTRLNYLFCHVLSVPFIVLPGSRLG